ncbi:MAG TPA: response regulator [Silvibacterium sp.]|nr:response regulator [Silvibacterium sp.]
MKRRILLVDDELAILLTLKAVLEISGFDVETAASAREAKMKLRAHEYHMVITDMRMESEKAGMEVVAAAKKAPSRPAIAMLTAFPLPGSEGEDGADKLLVKPMNTSDLLRQLEALLVTHEDSKRKGESGRPKADAGKSSRKAEAGHAMRKPAGHSVPAAKSSRKNATAKLAEAH